LLNLQIPGENPMNLRRNARPTPRGPERIVRRITSGQPPDAVAWPKPKLKLKPQLSACERFAKWVDRYRREGLAGLQDRSSPPHPLFGPPAHG